MVESKLSSPVLNVSPVAYLPVAMSILALVVIGASFLTGNAHQRDEGIAAHLWQILICGQCPILLFFAVKWIGRSNKKTMRISALQFAGLLANFAAVYFLKLG